MNKNRTIIKKIIFLILFISITTAFYGCWGYIDIKGLNILNGIGIDLTQEKEFFVNYEVISPNKVSEISHSGQERNYYYSTGKSIFDAGRNLTRYASGKRLYYQTCEVVVLGQKLCETGITPMIDFFTRDAKRRATVYPVIIEGDMKNLFSKDVKVDESVASSLVNIIKLYNYTGYAVNNNLSRTNIDSQSITGTMLLNKFKLVTDKNSENVYEPILDGVGVFLKNKLVGYLTYQETLAINILRKKVTNSIIVVNKNENNEEGRNITVEFSKLKIKFKPIIEDDNYIMNVDISADAAIVQYSEKEKLISFNYEELEKICSQHLEDLINKTFSKCKNQIKADPLNFGNIFANKYKNISKMDVDDWNNIFCNKLDMKTNIKINFTTTGITQEKSD